MIQYFPDVTAFAASRRVALTGEDSLRRYESKLIHSLSLRPYGSWLGHIETAYSVFSVNTLACNWIKLWRGTNQTRTRFSSVHRLKWKLMHGFWIRKNNPGTEQNKSAPHAKAQTHLGALLFENIVAFRTKNCCDQLSCIENFSQFAKSKI